ncbi:hypothetical protein [Okeania sp. KiyG1]|uniref:hypothetical protein n=1 Tax=Okeania sp. KiyG1 TaxID=2720165 RepID=UPI001923E9AE|nr:hypothetical protein [Okeania sp. KiyG1]GGA47873.1 hypothetical protein CYANOKiyG1_67010 [Okeania sp. KiyG1]
MSKSRNKFLIINEENVKDPFLVRNEFQKALAKERLIEEILLDNEFIEIEERKKTAKLKQVKITELDYANEKFKVEKIWRVNLEKQIPGISTSGKTTEVALLVLQKYEGNSYTLNIILVEMKSSLQPRKTKSGKVINSSFDEIHDKFRDSMNRMYMLLTLNNYGNPDKYYNRSSIKINFKGAIFYDRNEIKEGDIENDNEQNFYDIFEGKRNLLTCSTILSDNDKIKVKSFNNIDDQGSITVKIEDLLFK